MTGDSITQAIVGTLDFIFSETGNYWMVWAEEWQILNITLRLFVVESRLRWGNVGSSGDKLGVHRNSPSDVLAVAFKETSK